LLDVRAQDNLETLDMSRVGISYASSHFKGLSTGGNVSKVMKNNATDMRNIFFVASILQRLDIFRCRQWHWPANERATIPSWSSVHNYCY